MPKGVRHWALSQVTSLFRPSCRHVTAREWFRTQPRVLRRASQRRVGSQIIGVRASGFRARKSANRLYSYRRNSAHCHAEDCDPAYQFHLREVPQRTRHWDVEEFCKQCPEQSAAAPYGIVAKIYRRQRVALLVTRTEILVPAPTRIVGGIASPRSTTRLVTPLALRWTPSAMAASTGSREIAPMPP